MSIVNGDLFGSPALFGLGTSGSVPGPTAPQIAAPAILAADGNWIAQPTGTVPSVTGKNHAILTTDGATAVWSDPTKLYTDLSTGALTTVSDLTDKGGTVAAQRTGLAPTQALVTDGSVIGASYGLTIGAGDFTVSVRANLISSASGSYALISSTPAGGLFFVVRDTYVLIGAKNVSDTGIGYTTLTKNVWSNYCYTRISGVGVIYKDGVQIGTFADTTNYSLNNTFAGDNNYKYTGFTGQLAIFNRGLSASEVLQLYQSGLAPSVTALLLPESNAPGNGFVWNDTSGNGRHLVLQTSGVKWALPNSAINHIRGTTGTNGNEEILGANTLYPGCSLIYVNAKPRSGTPTVTVGNAAGNASFVASVTLASGWNRLALTVSQSIAVANGNAGLWVNSNSTDIIEWDISVSPCGV